MKIFIGTPCYGGMLTAGYFSSILGTKEKAKELGIELIISTMTNESLITRARNNMVAEFLKTDATHLFFIDADMSWKIIDFFKILNVNEDVVVGACPVKTLAFDNLVGKNIESIEHVNKLLPKYALTFDVQEDGSIPSHNGLVQMKNGGTAFMCIKRGAIEKMVEAYPEGKHKDRDGNTVYTLFDTMVYEEQYLSEDYAFCHKWRELGGKVLLHPDVSVDHFGSYNFKATPIKEFFSSK